MSTPSKDNEYRVILDLLCCVMAADGAATATEKQLIEKLLHDDGCSWSGAQTADVMNSCINRIKRDGVQATVKAASQDAKSLDAYRLEQLLWQCTDLAKADSNFSDREREVIQSIQLQIPQLRLMINAEDLRNSKNSSSKKQSEEVAPKEFFGRIFYNALTAVVVIVGLIVGLYSIAEKREAKTKFPLVANGMTKAEVIRILGEPRREIQLPSTEDEKKNAPIRIRMEWGIRSPRYTDEYGMSVDLTDGIVDRKSYGEGSKSRPVHTNY